MHLWGGSECLGGQLIALYGDLSVGSGYAFLVRARLGKLLSYL